MAIDSSAFVNLAGLFIAAISLWLTLRAQSEKTRAALDAGLAKISETLARHDERLKHVETCVSELKDADKDLAAKISVVRHWREGLGQ